MALICTILAVLGGVSFSIQGPINAGLGLKTNRFQATFISFSGGLLVIGLMTLLLGNGNLNLIKDAALWKLCGGLYGVFNVCVSVTCMPILGVTLALTVNMIGQLTVAAFIDSLGLFEVSVIPLTLSRITGILIAAAGILLIYIGNSKNTKVSEKKASKLPAMVLMFLSGVSGAAQVPTNRALANIIGKLEGTLINFVVGTLGILIIVLIVNKGKFVSFKENRVKPWQMLGGLFGSIGVFTNIFVISVIGSTLQTICQLSGQLLGAMVIDTTGALETKKIKINTWRIAGVLLIIGGVVVILLGRF